MRFKLGIVATALFLALSCQRAPETSQIDVAKLIDLTYAFDERTVYWPNAQGFRHHKDTWTTTPAGYWYAAGEFTSAEHGGTHIDSPVHFAEGRLTLDKIPVAKLVGPAAVIDISSKAAGQPDYRASPDDVTGWERTHGAIAQGAIVIFRTGWGKYWPDRKQYLGSDVPGDVTHLHFPGISRETAELLVKRDIAGVGVDTASLDHGPSTDFIAHRILNGAGIYGIENIANAERLPETGATIIALPMKIAEGSGGPARVIALLP